MDNLRVGSDFYNSDPWWQDEASSSKGDAAAKNSNYMWEMQPWWYGTGDPPPTSVSWSAHEEELFSGYAEAVAAVIPVIERHPEWLMENYVLEQAMDWANPYSTSDTDSWGQAWGASMSLIDHTIGSHPDVAPLIAQFCEHERWQIVADAMSALSGRSSDFYNDEFSFCNK